MRSNRAGLGNFVAWLASGERKRAAWSLSLFEIGAGASRSGNKTTNAGLAAPAGKALAKVSDKSEWGGLDFLASDAFVAEEKVKDREYHLKDTKDDNAPGVLPWYAQGPEKNIREAKPLESVVLRAAKVGPGFENEHVAFPVRAKLIAHHRPDDPPINSSQVYDPGDGGADDWHAGLHGPLRVRKWLDLFCNQRATSSDPEDQTFALLLNGTKSGGDNSGWLATHFANAETMFSAEVLGPLHPADDGNHLAGMTDDAPVIEGGIEFAVAKFGSRNAGWLYSPIAFNPAQWPFPPKHVFPALVELREDYTDRHDTLCGTAQGRKKLVTWFPLIEPGPPIREPKEPPEDPPPIDGPPDSPITPGPRNRQPGIIEVPFAGEPTGRGGVPASSTVPFEGEPTGVPGAGVVPGPNFGERAAAAMNQLEATSIQYRARPALPDGRLNLRALGTSEADALAGLLYGYTIDQAFTAPVVADDVASPEYLYASPLSNDDPNQRWPFTLSNEAELSHDAAGGITGRTPARGSGSVMLMPSNAPVDWMYVSAKGRWSGTPNGVTRIVMAGKNSAGVTIDGRTGLGLRTEQSGRIASGQEWRLGFDGTGGVTEPDLHLYPKTTTGAEGLDTGAAKLVIHEDVHITGAVTSDVTTFGTGDVTAAANITDNAIVRGDGGAKGVQGSGLIADDVALGALVVHTANVTSANSDTITLRTGTTTTSGDSGNLALDVGSAAGTAGVINVGTGNAESVSIGRSGKNTAVGGTLGSGVHTTTLAGGGAVSLYVDDGTNGANDYIEEVSTANATATTILTLPIPTNSRLSVSVQLTGQLSADATKSVTVLALISVYNNAGTPGTPLQTDIAVQDDSGALPGPLSVTTSGTDLLIQVTGIAATTIRWGIVARTSWRNTTA